MQGNNTAENMETEIDLAELFLYLLHWIWLIVVCGLAAGLAGFLVSAFLITPKYESTTGIYIMSRQNSDTLSVSDTQLATQLTKDYEALIISRSVLENVIAEEGLQDTYETLKSRVSVENTTDTRILTITVTDTNPSRARTIADAIRETAAQQIMEVTEVQAVNTVDVANLPTAPVSPSVRKWTMMGALIGIVLCMAVLTVIFLLDDTIKTSEDVEKYLGWGTLALIPTIEENQERRKVSKKAPAAAREEAARREIRETKDPRDKESRDKDPRQVKTRENTGAAGTKKQPAENKEAQTGAKKSAEESPTAPRATAQEANEQKSGSDKAEAKAAVKAEAGAETKENPADKQEKQTGTR